MDRFWYIRIDGTSDCNEETISPLAQGSTTMSSEHKMYGHVLLKQIDVNFRENSFACHSVPQSALAFYSSVTLIDH